MSLLLVVLLGNGCGNEGGDTGGQYGETGLYIDPCACDSQVNGPAYSCSCYILGEWTLEGYMCEPNGLTTADENCGDYCENLPYGPYSGDANGPAFCAGDIPDMSCSSWDPTEEVTLYSGEPSVYVMSWGFVSGLVADPEPLAGCDDATAILGEDGFVINDADSGELLYELGLRDGDILLQLNDIDIDTWAGAGYAFAYLWLTNGEASYTLEIERSSTPMKLHYYIEATR